MSENFGKHKRGRPPPIVNQPASQLGAPPRPSSASGPHTPPCALPMLLQPITKEELGAIFGPAAMHAIGHVAANLSFAAVAISLTHTVKTLEPAFNVVLSQLILGRCWAGQRREGCARAPGSWGVPLDVSVPSKLLVLGVWHACSSRGAARAAACSWLCGSLVQLAVGNPRSAPAVLNPADPHGTCPPGELVAPWPPTLAGVGPVVRSTL